MRNPFNSRPSSWRAWMTGYLTLVAVTFVFLTTAPAPTHAQWGYQWSNNGPSYLTRAQRRRLRRQRRRARARARNQRQARSQRRRSKSVKTVRLPKRRSDSGPIQIVVSLGKQKMTIYEGGKKVGRTRVSTGKDGHRTPTGIFSIIHKRRRHFSNIYNNAPMPYMQRLTWSGIALHQGVVPNYRTSHGCIRLPSGFAGQLFGFTERRSHVLIADGNPVPQAINHSALFQPSARASQPATATETSSATQLPVRMAMNTAGQTSQTDATASTIGDQAKKHEASRTGDAHLLASSDTDPELQAHRQLMFALRSEAPLRVLITRKRQQQRIKEAQQMLLDLGYDVGEPDGYIGKQSVKAIKAFQTDKELAVTGHPNDALFEALSKASNRSIGNEAFIYVRQKQKDIYSATIELVEPEKPLGTHLYTFMSIDETSGMATWNGMTAKARGRLPGQRRKKGEGVEVEAQTMGQALDRIRLPKHVRMRIEDMLTAGSSLIITDTGHARETGKDTDFIVLTR